MPTTFRSDPDASSFRKMAAALWHRSNDPSVYGYVDIDATPILAAIERLRSTAGQKLSVTHFVARAVALMFKKYPEVNAKVRFWGQIQRRESVDIFVQVAMDDGKDLSGVKIENCDRKSAIEIAQELAAKAKLVREHADPTLEKSRGMFRWLPWFLVRPLLWVSDFLVNELHFDLSGSGMPRDPFGTAMVTNIGMFGIDTAFAPLVPIARCALVVTVTEVKDRPWVVEKRVEVRPVLRCCATFDHRVVDGAYAGKLVREFTRCLADPMRLAEAPSDAPTIKATAGTPSVTV